jgi:hypothetical protein
LGHADERRSLEKSKLALERLVWGTTWKEAVLVSLDGEDIMLWKLTRLFALLVTVLGSSCTRTPSPGGASRVLAGYWELALGHDCRDLGIRSDTLVLHGDGTLEQHFISLYNQRYDSDAGRWSYSPDNHINFDGHKNFITKQPFTGVVGLSIPENLIVEFGRTPAILLNPDSDCFYRKTGDEKGNPSP